MQIGFYYAYGGKMNNILCSPIRGELVHLENVNDEMFSKKMLGDGIAIIPKAKEIFSPVDGVVTMVYETKHAIGIEMSSGLEILLHIGIDTVMLNGIPFDTKVEVGDQVRQGDLLTVVDWKYIENKGCDTIIPVLAINKKVKQIKSSGNVQPGDELFEIEN